MTDNTTFGSLTAMYHTFGCKLNFAETSAIAAGLASRGIVRAKAGQQPDIILINSCSVTEEADKKCRQTVRSLHRRHPGAAIILTGCYAQLKPEEAASLDGVAVVAGNDKKGRVIEYIEQWLADRAWWPYPPRGGAPSKQTHLAAPPGRRGARTRPRKRYATSRHPAPEETARVISLKCRTAATAGAPTARFQPREAARVPARSRPSSARPRTRPPPVAAK